MTCPFSQQTIIYYHMHNKKRRFERARTAPRHKNRIEERVSFGEEAKQELRNMSLINSSVYEEVKQIEWTKEQDNLSFRSFDKRPQDNKKTHKDGKEKTKFKKTCFHTRNSSPLLSDPNNLDAKRTSRTHKIQLIPSNLNINDSFNDQRMHTISPKQNKVNQQIRLFNEVIFRKTATILNRSFRPTVRHKSEESALQKRHKSQNYLALNFKKGCNKILPLQVQYPIGVDRNIMSKNELATQLQEKLKQNKDNLVRKMLKEQRMNSKFNENIITQRTIRPQF